jgi:hypothetical protein
MIINSLSPTSKSQCFSLALTGDLGNVTNAVRVSVFSVKGELVLNQTIQGEKLVKLNTSNFVNGSYTLQLIDNKGNCIKTEKLIVQQP